MAELHVVTPARWLAEDLSAGAPPEVRVVHDMGLDLPEHADGIAWWCPMNFAARLLASGVDPAFTAPGPGFTADMSEGVLGRRVVACRLAVAARSGQRWNGRPVHAKLAESKLRALPAAVYPDLWAFLAAAEQAHVPPGSMVQLSDPVEMVTEARCFVVDRQVVTGSVYLDRGTTWDGFATPPDSSWAEGFAGGVVARLHKQPPAYTLDVARLADGSLVVVEANPAWSSNPYHCEAGPVVAAILAAQGRRSMDVRRWRWQPDPSIPSRSYPLPQRRPVAPRQPALHR